MFYSALFDTGILVLFNFSNLSLSLLFHGCAQVTHLCLIFELDFVANTLMVVSDGCHLAVVSLMKRIFILLLTLFLLFLSHFQWSQVLFELSFLDSMLIFRVLESNLCLFLQISELVSVLEHQVHQSLHVNLDFNLMFLFQILNFTIFVSEFSFFIF